MKLFELKHVVDVLMEHEDNAGLPILITLNNPCMGGIAYTEVERASLSGFWEQNEFRIVAKDRIVFESTALTDTKPVKRLKFGGQSYYGCPRCTQKVAKGDKYCRHCGQKMR